MAKVRQDQPLVPSVLDRLIDEDPDNSREAPKSRHQVLREVKLSVQRDLENLLNTRCRCMSPSDEDSEFKSSLIEYGIPDFAGTNMGSSENRENVRRLVEDTVRRFEPRFKSVRVKLVENQDRADRGLRLRIDALMHAEPAPEPVVFDSQLEPVTGNFDVKTVAP